MSMENWWNDIDEEKPKYSEKKLTHGRWSDHCVLKSDLHCRLPLYLVQARYINCEDAQISTQWAQWPDYGLWFGSRQGKNFVASC